MSKTPEEIARKKIDAIDSQVCISTIQRLYSILKEEELDEQAEEGHPGEKVWQPNG